LPRTKRCTLGTDSDQQQLDFVNGVFRNILNEKEGQVKFVNLQPRPGVLPGQVIQVPLDAGLLPAGLDGTGDGRQLP